MHKFFFTIIFLCAVTSTHAQQKHFEYADSSLLTVPGASEEDQDYNEDTAVEVAPDILSDTTLYINKISLNSDSLQLLRNDKRFSYVKNLDSLLKKSQEEQSMQQDKNIAANSWISQLLQSGLLRMLFWTVAIGFSLFLLFKLFLNNGIFRSKGARLTNEEDKTTEVLASVSNYDVLIHQSYKLADYRLAVRYLFLKNLVHLADKEKLQLSADKTNYQYVQELPAIYKNEFSSLVLTYEYIWYGNFPLDQQSYNTMEKKFNSFFKKV